jgi:hypothetical protein
MGNCAGVDWASEKHDVLIEDPAGEELLAATFSHDEDGVSSLCAALACFEVDVVAIERPEGLLVDRLLEAGMQVLALHPNQVAAARDRFRASGGKSDQFDRFVLCELARTDRHRFRILEPDSDQTKALRALTRAREDLVAARVAMANQLRAELERFWPGPIGLFNDLDSPISLAFIERYPSPKDAHRLGEKRLAAFLKAGNYPNRKTAAQLLERLRQAPAGRAGELEIATRRRIVLALVGTLQTMVGQIAQLDAQIARDLEAHPDGEIFRLVLSQPRLGDLRRDPAGRDRRLSCALSPPRRHRRRRRPSPRRRRIWQTQEREVPLGVQQATAQRARRPGPQQQAMEPLGRRPLRPRARPGPQPPPRAAHPRPRPESHHLALLADPHPHDPNRHTGLQQHITVTIPSQSGPQPDLHATEQTAGRMPFSTPNPPPA